MKSFKKALFANKEYHHNLLGEEFDELVETATEKHLLRPQNEATHNVILAITDPNTGMELTPQMISQELKKQMRSPHPQKQYLAVCLVQEVLKECPRQIQPVLLEILEAVGVVATKNGTSEAARRAKTVAMEILSSHGNLGNQALRNSAGVRRLTAPNTTSTNNSSNPGEAAQLISHYDPIARQHCEVLRGLVQQKEMRESSLVLELLGEIRQMKKIIVGAVQMISNESSAEAETALITGVDIIDLIDRFLEFYEKVKNEPPELSMPDLISLRSLSFPSLGDQTQTIRRPSAISLDLELPKENLTVSGDPFQELANQPIQLNNGHPKPEPSNFNPFS